MDVEVIAPGPDYDQERPRARVVHWRAPGFLGAGLALLTMAAAFGVGFLLLFGTTLLAAAVATVAWPLIFSAAFTQWVFGEPRASFWKLSLLFLSLGFIAKALRRIR